MTADKSIVKEELRKKLGAFIEKLRNDRKLGFNQLALKSDVNVRSLNEIINGNAKRINPFHLQKIAKALNVDYRDFYRMIEYLGEDNEIELLKIQIKKLKNSNIIQNNNNNGDILVGSTKNIYNSLDEDLKGLNEDEIQLVKNYIVFLKSQKLAKK